jgi:flagellar motor switch protein FliG
VERIIGFLRGESPQTVALVVSHLHPTLAGRVLSQLPEALQAETALRVAQLGSVSPDVVRDVEKHARRTFASTPQPDHPTVVGAKLLAQILSRGDLTTERTVLGGLEDTDEPLAAEVRQLLVTFEDIAGLDERAVQLIIREADQKDLTLALGAASNDLKQHILSNMSPRAAQMLLDELEIQPPPQRRRVVEEAQDRVVAIVRRLLEEAGAIILPRAGEDPAL